MTIVVSCLTHVSLWLKYKDKSKYIKTSVITEKTFTSSAKMVD